MDGLEKAQPVLGRFQVFVIYNGLQHGFAVELHELVRLLREQALRVFGIHQNQHTFALYTEAGVELREDVTIAQAGIRPDEKLLLRPRAVLGG
jgi:hypothetical protein